MTFQSHWNSIVIKFYISHIEAKKYVKLALCLLINHYDMKAYGGVDV
jgi:hypothetical protein